MDLRQHVTPIRGQRIDGATGGVHIPRHVLTTVIGMAAALLLGVAVGRGLPTTPEASVTAQSPAPAAEPVVSYVNIRPQVVDQSVGEDIPTF